MIRRPPPCVPDDRPHAAARSGRDRLAWRWHRRQHDRLLLDPVGRLQADSRRCATPGRFSLSSPVPTRASTPRPSWPEYRDLRDRLRTITGLMAFRMAPLYVGESGHVERGNGLLVSSNYFSALGLEPAVGRFLRAEETDTRSDAVIVISYDYWKTRFGLAERHGRAHPPRQRPGSDDYRRRATRISGHRDAPDVRHVASRRRWHRCSSTARVRSTIAAVASTRCSAGSRQAPLVQAHRTELDAAMRELAVAFPQTNTGMRAEILSFWEAPRGPQRLLAASLVILQAITLLLLLAVCGNTANLVLARASTRRQEMAVRLALGAKPWHIGRLLLTESVLLALCGGFVGAALALWGTNALSAVPPMRVRGIPISLLTTVDGTGSGGRHPARARMRDASLVWCLRFSSSRVDPQQLRLGSSTPSRRRSTKPVDGGRGRPCRRRPPRRRLVLQKLHGNARHGSGIHARRRPARRLRSVRPATSRRGRHASSPAGC